MGNNTAGKAIALYMTDLDSISNTLCGSPRLLGIVPEYKIGRNLGILLDAAPNLLQKVKMNNWDYIEDKIFVSQKEF